MGKLSDYIDDIMLNKNSIFQLTKEVDVLGQKVLKLERMVKDQEDTIEQLMKTVSELWRRL